MKSLTICLKDKVKRVQNYKDIENSNMSGLGNYEDISIAKDFNEEKVQQSLFQSKIKEIENELEKAKKEFFQMGFEKGKKSTEIEMEQQIKEMYDEFNSMIKSFSEQYEKVFEGIDRLILKLAKKVARKIIDRELIQNNGNDDFLLNQIKKLLNKVTNQSRIVIYLNPRQVDVVTKLDIHKELKLPLAAEVDFVEDGKLNPGECLVETENYILDSRIIRMLDNIEDKLLG